MVEARHYDTLYSVRSDDGSRLREDDAPSCYALKRSDAGKHFHSDFNVHFSFYSAREQF